MGCSAGLMVALVLLGMTKHGLDGRAGGPGPRSTSSLPMSRRSTWRS
jgi:hypothetical protein